ncbi:hypothetical protein QYE76_046743 [Lolium multiflorum]|uniref:Uncharacterized protein n=1 Tax=Lolium multiflorum TaxID=4521 RepID=A0AAD8TML3_LOLMU|nr:hypothetical protein QYE76_046743 [Lolium multiflorum]
MMKIGASSQTDFVDMDKMVTSITKEINSFWSAYESSKGHIQFQLHKVPQHIREVDKNCYEPIVLSIGPYSHGSQSLILMEKEKWKSLDYILKLNCKVTLQDYIRAMSKLEKQARDCYSGEIPVDKKNFLQMLLLDACFILVKVDGTVLAVRRAEDKSTSGTAQKIVDGNAEDIVMPSTSNQSVKSHKANHVYAADSVPEIELTIVRDNEVNAEDNKLALHYNGQKSDGNVVSGDWYASAAWHDLFLLENQIPFFVIEAVYKLVATNGLTMPLLADTIVDCVENILRQFPSGIKECNRPRKIHHLLHLCHIFFRPTQKLVEIHENQPNDRFFHHLVQLVQRLNPVQQDNCLQDGPYPRWRQAIQYHEAGIQLNKREYSNYNNHSLLDIRFSNGVVEIPCFAIDENTESLFRNLIALEQTDSQFGNDVSTFISFMSHLVMTPDDATLLAKRGIIVHMLHSDEEVSALFVRLTKDVTLDITRDNYMSNLFRTLENHYQNRLNRWIAWLWQTHFSNPWLALAVVAAAIVLLCTIVQTWFTVLAYVHPPK